MTEVWQLNIKVKGETTDSLCETYESLDRDGIDNLNRTGKVRVISTSWFDCAERDEIGIDITVEVPDTFDDMREEEKESMIYELCVEEYADPWLRWFRDDLDDEDWEIYVCYNGKYL